MDFNEWESKMKHDPLVVDALKKRGIDDPDLLQIDPWPIANFGKKKKKVKDLLLVDVG